MAVIQECYPRALDKIRSLMDYLRHRGAKEVIDTIASRNSGGTIEVYHYSDSTVVLVDDYKPRTLIRLVVANEDDTKAKEVFSELEAILEGETAKGTRPIPQMDQI